MSINQQFATAIESGDVATVEQILKQSPSLANAESWTPPPLHCAVLWNRPRIAELLLDHGADMERLDPDRRTTPLRYAILYARPDLIPVLVARGANAGPIREEGTTAMELALEAAGGAYEQYDDLPRASAYSEIVQALRDQGVA